MTEATQTTEVSNAGAVSWMTITEPTIDDFPEHEENVKKLIDLIFDEYPISHVAVNYESSLRWFLEMYKSKEWPIDKCTDEIIFKLKYMKHFSMMDQGHDYVEALDAMDITDTKENREHVSKFLIEKFS